MNFVHSCVWQLFLKIKRWDEMRCFEYLNQWSQNTFHQIASLAFSFYKIQFQPGRRLGPRCMGELTTLPRPRLLRGTLENLKNMANFAVFLDASSYKAYSFTGLRALPPYQELCPWTLLASQPPDPIIGSHSAVAMVPYLSLTPRLPILRKRSDCTF